MKEIIFMHLLPKLLGYLWKPDVKSDYFTQKIKNKNWQSETPKKTLFFHLKNNNHHLPNRKLEVITFMYCTL
jgi:hypothetical protein